MSEKLDALNAKVDELQVTVDAVQAKIEARLLADAAIIADLQSQIANGATPEQLQAVVDKIEAANVDLAATSA